MQCLYNVILREIPGLYFDSRTAVVDYVMSTVKIF
jgi:hypothetical protein